MPIKHKLIPCLWFDDQAEAAAKYYINIFKNSKITRVTHYGEAGKETHKRPPGSVLTVAFELEGEPFTALNGGPDFTFNEAISFQVTCETQDEIDYYWNRLKEGGDEKAQICGWLKDKFGVSWQVIPSRVDELVGDPNSEKSQRAMSAMMKMKKIDIEELERAYEGSSSRPEPRVHQRA